jgi:dTDP-4-dehydrorhamnose reductase
MTVEQPEVWAGVECTVNRVGDRYFDQVRRSGHHTRLDDLDRFAGLGVRALRYPVVWERTAPDGLDTADWRWADERLGRLRRLGIRPIVGLVHHGSGPRYAPLDSDAFAPALAEFALAVARRYPWLEDFTPVNEPLTTARFAGLYGFWYPHGRDGHAFVRALLSQTRAIVSAMRAIRRVIPHARLVQTEDAGTTFSTAALAYQAAHENARRWLSLDLLAGRVDDEHPLWQYLLRHGAGDSELASFLDEPCPPDLVGLNHYVTSDRFLDEDLGAYPVWSHGGNGRHGYADVEALRAARCPGRSGHLALLQEAGRRYGKPLAITEVHLGGPREEQLRWLAAAWGDACAARRQGLDVRAVTVWSLLGCFDWNRLVVSDAGFYEPGVFDVRAVTPRGTALATMTRTLAEGSAYQHAVLGAPGWWARPECRPYGATAPSGPIPFGRPVLITGATGTLGRAFDRVCAERGLARRVVTRSAMDIGDAASVKAALDAIRPWAVINTAGYVRVDDAESERDRCWRENATGVGILAAACAARGLPLVTYSSDLVFDGTLGRPYAEDDPVSPLNVYGASKAAGEHAALARNARALVIRTSAFFGPWDEYNFVTIGLSALAAGKRFSAAGDCVVSPTFVPDLVNATLDLVVDGEAGIWHLANQGSISWAYLLRAAARGAGLDEQLVDERPGDTLGWVAPRPRCTVLGSARGELLPSLDDALSRYLAATAERWTARAAATTSEGGAV